MGYRAPGRVLDFASRLLPAAAPGVAPDLVDQAWAHRAHDPRACRSEEVAAASLAEAYALMADHALIAVIAPDELVPELVAPRSAP